MTDPLVPPEAFWTPHKLVSLLVAGAYLVVGLLSGDVLLFVSLLILVVVALACIWFSGAMGSYTGLHGIRGTTRTTSGVFVYYGGWLLLMAPLVLSLIIWFMSEK